MKTPTPETLLQSFPALQVCHPCGSKAAIKAAQAALQAARQLASTPHGVLLLAAALLLTQTQTPRRHTRKTL